MTTLLIAITLFAVIGIGSGIFWKPDNPIEEESEVLIEDSLELGLNLPPDSLKGKIDLTPSSQED